MEITQYICFNIAPLLINKAILNKTKVQTLNTNILLCETAQTPSVKRRLIVRIDVIKMVAVNGCSKNLVHRCLGYNTSVRFVNNRTQLIK